MTINRKSSPWRLAARLMLAVLLADIAGAAAIVPAAGSGVFADLARICRSGGDAGTPAQSDDALCVFCLPLVGGTAATPAEIGLPVPLIAGATGWTPRHAGGHPTEAQAEHLPRGPPGA